APGPATGACRPVDPGYCPGLAKPGVKLQREALEDLAAGLAGGGGAPADQDLGEQGMHRGLAPAEPADDAVMVRVNTRPWPRARGAGAGRGLPRPGRGPRRAAWEKRS